MCDKRLYFYSGIIADKPVCKIVFVIVFFIWLYKIIVHLKSRNKVNTAFVSEADPLLDRVIREEERMSTARYDFITLYTCHKTSERKTFVCPSFAESTVTKRARHAVMISVVISPNHA